MGSRRDIQELIYHLQIQLNNIGNVLTYHQHQKDIKINTALNKNDDLMREEYGGERFRLIQEQLRQLDLEIADATQIIERTLQERDRIMNRISDLERQLSRL